MEDGAFPKPGSKHSKSTLNDLQISAEKLDVSTFIIHMLVDLGVKIMWH